MQRLIPHLNWLSEQQQSMVSLLQKWSAINSGSYNIDGLSTMLEAIKQSFSFLGGEIETLDSKAESKVGDSGEMVTRPLGKVLRISKHQDVAKKILLTGHMDTVFPQDSAFQTPVLLDKNTLNGPGVADMKGGIIVMLMALQSLESSPFAGRVGWQVLINADEEIGSVGSEPYLQEAAKNNHLGLIFEPALADGTLAGVRKGSGNFTLVVRGKAAHAGREHHLGRNAIVLLAKIIGAIESINQYSGITVNTGRITGGGPVNVVPDLAVAEFNIRIESVEQQLLATKTLTDIVEKYTDLEGYQVELHGGFTRPPKPMTKSQQQLFELLSNCGQALAIQIRHHATGGCCDGNNLAAAGLPNIDTLGVRGGNIHSDSEFVLLDSLVERARLSSLLLLSLASDYNIWPDYPNNPEMV